MGECLFQLILYFINIIITVVVVVVVTVRQELTDLSEWVAAGCSCPWSPSAVLAEVCFCACFFCGCWRCEIRFPCMYGKHLPTKLSSRPVVGFLDFF